MEILVLKNGKVDVHITRADDNAEYTLITLSDDKIPEYPTENPGRGKEWGLAYNDGVLYWDRIDRPLTTEERLEQLQQDVETIKYEWKVGETVTTDDRRYYLGVWYTCLQPHTTQADWTPDIAMSLWRAD